MTKRTITDLFDVRVFNSGIVTGNAETPSADRRSVNFVAIVPKVPMERDFKIIYDIDIECYDSKLKQMNLASEFIIHVYDSFEANGVEHKGFIIASGPNAQVTRINKLNLK